jgi:hypothetical protein
MMHQLIKIIRLTRPKHILKAFVSPIHLYKAFKYHYRRVSERAFIGFLAKLWGCSPKDIDDAYNDLDSNLPLWKEIEKNYPYIQAVMVCR